MVLKDRLRFASRGDPTLLVLTLPAVFSKVEDEVDVYAIPLDSRTGGLLLALPHESVSPQTISDGQIGTDELLFGPNSNFMVGLIEESEDLTTTVDVGTEAQVLVVDVHDDVLAFCREYDPVTDSLGSIFGFSNDHPGALPDTVKLWPLVSDWLLQRSDDRTGFYTAQEDQVSPLGKAGQVEEGAPQTKGRKAAPAKRVTNAAIAEQLNVLVAQMQVLTQRQDRLEKAGSSADLAPGPFVGPSTKLPAVSAGLAAQKGGPSVGFGKALNLVGPPPKIRNPPPLDFAGGVGQEEPYDALQPVEAEQSGIAAALTRHIWLPKQEISWEIFLLWANSPVPPKEFKEERKCRTISPTEPVNTSCRFSNNCTGGSIPLAQCRRKKTISKGCQL